jgi:hypothetical protein
MEINMAYEFHPGETVPESGIYWVTHSARHITAEHEVTVIKGRRFPTCRQCKGIGFGPVHQAKHVSEIPHLHEEGATALA